MPTAAERQALVFLGLIAVIGGGARIVGAHRFRAEVGLDAGSAPTAAARHGEHAALERQLAAIDSAQAAAPARAPRKRFTTSTRATRPTRSTRATRPPGSAASGTTAPDTAWGSEARSRARGSKVVTDHSSGSALRPTLASGGRRTPPPLVDVDLASAIELERLPRVGPALARRIVAWRDEHGPFGSIDALRHVRGIGVTTAARLAPLVTFSGRSRPYRSDDPPAPHHPPPLHR